MSWDGPREAAELLQAKELVLASDVSLGILIRRAVSHSYVGIHVRSPFTSFIPCSEVVEAFFSRSTVDTERSKARKGF